MTLNVDIYSERGFTVRGDTKPHIEKFKEMGGKYNPYLIGGPGWVFSIKNRLIAVNKYVDKVNNENKLPKIIASPSKKRKGIDTESLNAWKRRKIKEIQEAENDIDGVIREVKEAYEHRKLELEYIFEQNTKIIKLQYESYKRDLDFNHFKDVTESVLVSTHYPNKFVKKPIKLIMFFMVALMIFGHIQIPYSWTEYGKEFIYNSTRFVNQTFDSLQESVNQTVYAWKESVIPRVTLSINQGTDKIREMAFW
jgi:hypothetical protein